jgi:BCCT family betaine/carnitine transporter
MPPLPLVHRKLLIMSNSATQTAHSAGQNNQRVLGLDVHLPVFILSALIASISSALVLAAPDVAAEFLGNLRNSIMSSLDWFFSLSVSLITIFIVTLALSPLGRLRLGGVSAKPDFGYTSWISMLFSAGVGIGMTFYGAAEPLAYYTGWYGTPFNVAANTASAENLALGATLFNWGVGPWSIYALFGLGIAFLTMNLKLPVAPRIVLYPIIGERCWGWPGHIVDTLAILATVLGLATSLGLGARQAAGGLNFLFGVDGGLSTQIFFIAIIALVTVASVVRGLDKGIRVLSNFTMILALVLLGFLLLVGPTSAILASYGDALWQYSNSFLPLSNFIGREDTTYFHGWTIFYWAWWISWSPFVGLFLARISRGRTVREFISVTLLAPLAIALIWFSSFGTAAIEQAKGGVGDLANGIDDVSLVLFQLFAQLPWSELASVVALVLLIVFFVTSSDSGALVIDSVAAGGKTNTPLKQRVFWACIISLLAIVLLVGGGAKALDSLQAWTLTAALPFTFVLFITAYSLVKTMLKEYAQTGLKK